MPNDFADKAAARQKRVKPVENIVRYHYDDIKQARAEGVSFDAIHAQLLADGTGKLSLSGLKRAFKIVSSESTSVATGTAVSDRPARADIATSSSPSSHVIADTRRRSSWGDEA